MLYSGSRMKTRSLQIRVGALVLVALAVLVAFVLVLGDLAVGQRTHYVVELHDSGSVLRGAPVKIAGVRAGRVERVEFVPDHGLRQSAPLDPAEPPINVRINIAVDAEMAVSVRRDSEFFVTTQGVLGEKYIEIVPGRPDSAPWPDGAYVRGRDPARIDLLFARVDSILAKLEVALGQTGDLEIGRLIRVVTRLAERLDGLMAERAGAVGAIVDDVGAITSDGRVLVASLREGIGPPERIAGLLEGATQLTDQLSRRAAPTLARVDGLIDTVDSAVEQFGGLLDRAGPRVERLLDEVEPAAADARAMLRDGAVLTESLRGGEGTVGALLGDREIYDDLKEMLRNLKRHPWKMIWKE